MAPLGHGVAAFFQHQEVHELFLMDAVQVAPLPELGIEGLRPDFVEAHHAGRPVLGGGDAGDHNGVGHRPGQVDGLARAVDRPVGQELYFGRLGRGEEEGLTNHCWG